jgi:hypothetical protein
MIKARLLIKHFIGFIATSLVSLSIGHLEMMQAPELPLTMPWLEAKISNLFL